MLMNPHHPHTHTRTINYMRKEKGLSAKHKRSEKNWNPNFDIVHKSWFPLGPVSTLGSWRIRIMYKKRKRCQNQMAKEWGGAISQLVRYSSCNKEYKPINICSLSMSRPGCQLRPWKHIAFQPSLSPSVPIPGNNQINLSTVQPNSPKLQKFFYYAPSLLTKLKGL